MNALVPTLTECCILIPCYNNFDGLIDAVKSINYTKNKYVVVVVDDGSLNPVSKEKIHQRIDCTINIEVIRLEANQGITRALNKGLEFIYANYSTRYIARLDCGDICSSQRFYTQIAFFEKHPAIHLTGTWCYFKDNNTGTAYKYNTPTVHKQIQRDMYFRNVFIHPTVMWRMKAIGKILYPEKYPCAEDYGLFYDMISNKQSAIIGEYLVTCEINPKGISIKNRSIQLKSRLKVVSFYGKNKLLYLIGAIKLNFLMLVPYQVIFFAKKNIYKTT